MQRRRFLAAAGATVTAVALAGCNGDATGSTPRSGGAPTDTSTVSADPNTPTATASGSSASPEVAAGTENEGIKADVRVESSELVTAQREGTTEAAVFAQLKNVGSGRSPFVQAVVGFGGATGDLLEVNTASVLGLDAGERWDVYIPYSGAASDVTRHKVAGTFNEYRPLPTDQQMTLRSHSLDVGEDSAVVSGTAVNSGTDSLRFPEVKVKFYADNGHLLATGVANTTGLLPETPWSFQIPFSTPDPRGLARLASHEALVTDHALSLRATDTSTSVCGQVDFGEPANC